MMLVHIGSIVFYACHAGACGNKILQGIVSILPFMKRSRVAYRVIPKPLLGRSCRSPQPTMPYLQSISPES
jgi:hypothetical protein